MQGEYDLRRVQRVVHACKRMLEVNSWKEERTGMSGKVNEARTLPVTLKGVREVLNMKFDTLPFEGDWFEAFNTPEHRGVWFIWGTRVTEETSFVMQLCKYLCQFGRVAYDSLEEGACLTMQNTLMRFKC